VSSLSRQLDIVCALPYLRYVEIIEARLEDERSSPAKIPSTRSMARLAGSRVLPVEFQQNRVQRWVVSLHLQRFVEEVFCDHCEEFPRIGATVSVQKSARFLRGTAAQLVVFARANLYPALLLPALGQGWRAVDATVEHVEFVAEFVIDDVVTSLGMGGIAQHGVPYQHNRTTQDRLSVDREPGPLHRDPGGERRVLSRRDDRRTIDKRSWTRSASSRHQCATLRSRIAFQLSGKGCSRICRRWCACNHPNIPFLSLSDRLTLRRKEAGKP